MSGPRFADISLVFRGLVDLGAHTYFDIFENRGMFGDDPSDSALVLVRRDVSWVRTPLADFSALSATVDQSFQQHPAQPL